VPGKAPSTGATDCRTSSTAGNRCRLSHHECCKSARNAGASPRSPRIRLCSPRCCIHHTNAPSSPCLPCFH